MKKIFVNIICTIILMLIPISVFSMDEQGTIIVSFEYEDVVVSNVNFNLYKIATYDSEDNLKVSSDFKNYSEQLKDLDEEKMVSLVSDLSSYVAENNIKSYDSKITSNEVIKFKDLEKGLYFLSGDILESEDGMYVPQSILVTIPMVIDDIETYDVIVKPKCEFLKWIEDIRVEKKWDDENYKNRPKEVIVQLLKDGEIYEEVTLNNDNKWEYIWTKLTSGDYQIVEKNIPKNYKATITYDDGTYTITNTLEKSDKLIETGQLWIPVILLLVGGSLLIFIGLMMKKKEKKD